MVIDKGAFWITLYFLCNLGLTIYNKVVLTSFKYPWALTGIHVGMSGLGAAIAIHSFKMTELKNLNKNQMYILMGFSILYTINIAISNVSLEMVSLPFHQIIRSTNPAVTIGLEFLVLKKIHDTPVYISLCPVILGVCIATYGELEYTILGFILTVVGVLLSSFKGIATNILMVGDLKLHPLEVLYRMAPFAGIQCLIYSYITGELSRLLQFVEESNNGDGSKFLGIPFIFISVIFNGLLAFTLNVVSFTANKETSALSMTVAGNVKQVLSITYAVLFMGYTLTLFKGFGILITLCGGGLYSYVSYMEKQRKLNGPLPM